MPTDVIMPALGMAQDTGKVLRWLKTEGDTVKKGEPLLEIETDKVTVDVESPADGVLGGVRAVEGDDVPVGQAIAVVLAAGESLETATAARTAAVFPLLAPAAAPGGRNDSRPPAMTRRRPASPKARRIASERGIDIDAVAGSGPNGTVVAADVEALTVPAHEPAFGGVGAVWRRMAERTTQSWQTVPHFVLRREVDATRLQSWLAVARAQPDTEDVSPTDLLIKLAAETLRRHPRVNSSWQEGAIVPAEHVNVAVAVATSDGLVAPVVHDADRLNLAAIAARRKDIVAAARAGTLRPEDVSGGTFTISNLGMYGVDSFDAIINAPQAAILAVGRIADRLVPLNGLPAVRPTLQLTVSFDHRAVDGARAAEFLATLVSLIEEPAGLVD